MAKIPVPPTAPLQFIKDRQNLYKGLIALPACDESLTLPEVLSSLERNDPAFISEVLLIINVNNRDSSDTSDNFKTLSLLKSYSGSLHLAYLNSTEKPFAYPEKFGVGLARHQAVLSGLDFIENKSPVISLDGDSPVNKDYLSAIFTHLKNNPNFGAGHVDFKHRLDGSEDEASAIQLYDRHLHMHREGLHRAGSPHAWYAIGSTIVCTKEAYLKSGGYNARRMAGEDFYILQQLSKVGCRIEMIPDAIVYPSNRQSSRVPFGTGKAVIDILSSGECFTYNPQCYEALSSLLKTVYCNLKSDAETLIKSMPLPARDWLLERDFITVWKKLQSNSKTEAALKQRFNEWFDAFQTLKFIHYLTENGMDKVKIEL